MTETTSGTDHRRHVYTAADDADLVELGEIAELADLIETAEDVEYAALRLVGEANPLEGIEAGGPTFKGRYGRFYDQNNAIKRGAVRRLVTLLGLTGRLDGAVIYDECGETGETIVCVYENPMGETWIETRPSGGEYLGELADDCAIDQFVGLPGTKLYGAYAIVELARARLAPAA